MTTNTVLNETTVRPYRWRWPALFVILGMEIMDLLDALVTTVAAPTIRADLGGSASLIQWLGAGYTLAMAVGLLTGGRLGDIYGRKRMFLIGTAGFTAASLLCAVAQSPQMLISARVLQGLLGAMVLPQGLGMIKEMFPPKEMAAACGAFGPIMGLSAVGGPILAGYLVDADLFGSGWRSIFAINIPIGVVTVAFAVKYLPSTVPHRAPLDAVGAVLGAAGAALIVYPLVQGRELGWPFWTYLMMAGSAVVFAAFGWHENRIVARGRQPLIEPSLFRKRAFSGGMLVGLAVFSAMIGFSLVFTLYQQVGLGWSPLKSALASSPMAVGMVIGFIAAGVGLAEKYGRLLIHLGLGAMIAGIGVLMFTIWAAGTDVTPWELIPALGLVGLGMGHAMAPMFDIILAGVEPRETGSAGGTLTAVQQLGGSLGIAILGTVFFSAVGGSVVDRVNEVAPDLRSQLISAGLSTPDAIAAVEDLKTCGHDRASSEDVLADPASCQALGGQLAAVPPEVAASFAAAGQEAGRKGFGDVIMLALVVEAGLALAAFQLVYLLPRRARPPEEPQATPEGADAQAIEGGSAAASSGSPSNSLTV
ncbi:MAG TPA: MFS transporter [Sporichthya sp.]|nr:MFS transporter [Sporichthya sp.]